MYKTILEKYYKKGWLRLGFELFGASDRLMIGHCFYRDYAKSHILSVGVSDLSKPFVDGGARLNGVENRLDHRDKFLKACQSMSQNQRKLLEQVVLEEKDILSKYEKNVKKIKELKRLLCGALDCLIFYYLEEKNDRK